MSSEAVSKVELMEINMGRFNSTKWPVNGTGVAQKINNKFITEKKKKHLLLTHSLALTQYPTIRTYNNFTISTSLTCQDNGFAF